MLKSGDNQSLNQDYDKKSKQGRENQQCRYCIENHEKIAEDVLIFESSKIREVHKDRNISEQRARTLLGTDCHFRFKPRMISRRARIKILRTPEYVVLIRSKNAHMIIVYAMADHDKRRKVLKKRRRSEESRSHGEEEMVGVERLDELLWLQEMRESDDVRDLIAIFQDLVTWSFSSHTAKAA
ncbi:hypothetical protein Bca4012_025538 [Brassica carinata]